MGFMEPVYRQERQEQVINLVSLARQLLQKNRCDIMRTLTNGGMSTEMQKWG